MVDGINKDASPAQIRNARRIESLRVNEVSVVDRPAIRRTFLVAKNEEGIGGEITDPIFESVQKAVDESLAAQGLCFGTPAEGKGLPQELRKNLGSLLPWLRSMAHQAEGNVQKAIMEGAVLLSNLEAGLIPGVETNMAKNTDNKEAEGMSDEERAEMEAKRKAKEKEEEEEMKRKAKEKEAEEVAAAEAAGKEVPKNKAHSLDGTESGTVIKVDDSGNIQVLTKGRKMMTEERAQQLAQSAKSILGLLKETDEGLFKATVEAAQKEMPRDPKFQGGVSATPTTKSEGGSEDPVLKALAEIQKSQEAQAARLDKIEKARTPSTSVNGEGDTTSTVNKSAGVWSGIFPGL